ncbi:heparinase II/III family protein [Lacinutrix sp. Hel_I_90]|uniref:heparinase II/III domain-containing protein n=1 Tax=Lacinutrix sp. Hel_I_90 TaxID=1249999 RepID=UPI0005C94CEF|nr:heparinase II/III family protein [Lacinutrix sp. Hel_I_90]
MIQKTKLVFNLLKNMGLRYVLYRTYYAISTKLGWQKIAFPTQPKFEKFITLDEWRKNLPPFFFFGKNINNLPREKDEKLKKTFEEIENGRFTFFSKQKFDLGKNYDWMTNPVTNHKYNSSQHWSEIQDISIEAGDIKFVWEKARFSFLFDIIRYDYHFEEDQSQLVFNEIEDFIEKNPINQGPNYKCSQEISLRLLNWTFALYYYKDSEHLNDALFQKIINAIYWQLHHVYKNIHFSRIAVRNNHAITETLTLYLSAKLFPFITDTKKWSVKGKAWFEQEIEYQIYKDGTFLQFSMNYHRVVLQLLTWAMQLSKLNKDKFKPVVYDRAKKSLDFLDTCLDPISGELPNYGSNDGALFFKLTNCDFRNYKSQLNDLRLALVNNTFVKSESAFWYGLKTDEVVEYVSPKETNSFNIGGYYIMQDKDVKTFIRCGKYKDRPFQSDNLHMDIWVNGKNILRDSGSYKYNTEKAYLNYFNGCEGHNTVSVLGENQMLKGNRFIWYNWVKDAQATLVKNETTFSFKGKIKAFKNIGNNISHHRSVTKETGENKWNVIDSIENVIGKEIYQYWHINPEFHDSIIIESFDADNHKLEPIIEEKWFSGYYGIKEKSIRVTFVTAKSSFKTTIIIDS